MNEKMQSPNFEFLRDYDTNLVTLAARAERFVFDDPNITLLKAGQFAELLHHHTYHEMRDQSSWPGIPRFDCSPLAAKDNFADFESFLTTFDCKATKLPTIVVA